MIRSFFPLKSNYANEKILIQVMWRKNTAERNFLANLFTKKLIVSKPKAISHDGYYFWKYEESTLIKWDLKQKRVHVEEIWTNWKAMFSSKWNEIYVCVQSH